MEMSRRGRSWVASFGIRPQQRLLLSMRMGGRDWRYVA